MRNRFSCWLWNIAHNAIAHPLMPFLPEALSNPIHDWTAKHWAAAISRKQVVLRHVENADDAA